MDAMTVAAIAVVDATTVAADITTTNAVADIVIDFLVDELTS